MYRITCGKAVMLVAKNAFIYAKLTTQDDLSKDEKLLIIRTADDTTTYRVAKKDELTVEDIL